MSKYDGSMGRVHLAAMAMQHANNEGEFRKESNELYDKQTDDGPKITNRIRVGRLNDIDNLPIVTSEKSNV